MKMTELRILFTVKYQNDTKIWKVFKESVNPSYGYAFGTLQGDFEQVGEFNSQFDAINFILGFSKFNQFILTDLQSVVLHQTTNDRQPLCGDCRTAFNAPP